MDRNDHSSAQIIAFPKGGRDSVRRPLAPAPAATPLDAPVGPGVDCSAWYHQAAMQDAAAPRRS